MTVLAYMVMAGGWLSLFVTPAMIGVPRDTIKITSREVLAESVYQCGVIVLCGRVVGWW